MAKIEVFRKQIGLDKFWYYKRSELACPFCFQKGLWVDSLAKFGFASHFCRRCDISFLLKIVNRREVIVDEKE